MSKHTRISALIGAIALAIAALVSPAAAQSVPAPNKPDAIKPDATLGSTPGTVVWGYFAARIKPALRIKSGMTVRIDTLSHQGVLTKDDPVTFFGAGGVRPDEVLQDAKDIYAKVPHSGGLGAHVLTGPIFVEGAEPGDMLEVRVRDLELRVPYGVNSTGPGSGVLPDLVAKPTPLIIRTDAQRKVALLPGGIELPLAPFLGVMAVAPPPDLITCAGQLGAAGTMGQQPRPARAHGRATRSICRCSPTARCSTPATRTACRPTARSTAPRSSTRSPRRCSSSCTRAPATPCAGRAPRMRRTTMRSASISTSIRR